MQLTIFKPDGNLPSAKNPQGARVTFQSWEAFCEQAVSKPALADSKAMLPLIKLGTFNGDSRAQGSSLETIYGVEGDYDGEEVSLQDAAMLLAGHNITALLYSSPSHKPDKPRWRVLCPTSKPLEAAMRRMLIARLNAALGGILSVESFTDKQVFFMGRVVNAPFEVQRVNGNRCIDEAQDIMAPIGDRKAVPGAVSEIPDDELRHNIVDGAKGLIYPSLLSLSARLIGRGMAPADAAASLRGLLDSCTWKFKDPQTWKERMAAVEGMVAGAHHKYADPRKHKASEWPSPLAEIPVPDDLPPIPPVEAYDEKKPKAEWKITPQEGSAFAQAFQPLPDLIPGILRTRYIYSLTAPTNAGKTALAVHLSLRLALGYEFAGQMLNPGRVLYLAGENPYDVQARLLAECQLLGISPAEIGDRITVIAQSFQLPTAVTALADAVRGRGEYRLVVVDTVPAYAWYEEENSNAEARQMASALRSIESMVPGNPTVLAPCHPRKGALADDLEPRGGGAFLAELDGNLTCWLADGVMELHWQKKLRQAAFAPVKFRIVETALEDHPLPDGTPYKTVCLEWIDERQAEDMEREGYERENRILYEMAHNPRGSMRDWAVASNVPTGSVLRIIRKLEKDKLIKQGRNRKWHLTETGKTEAESIR